MQNPTEKLDELRRSSLIEVEHLQKAAASGSAPNTFQRDMPQHASLLASELEKIDEHASEDESSSSYFGHSPSFRNAAMQQTSHFRSGAPAVMSTSIATETAELSGAADSRGAPIFEEPEFGRDEMEDVQSGPPLKAPTPQRIPLHRQVSPGSFSAASILQSEHLSPTER